MGEYRTTAEIEMPDRRMIGSRLGWLLLAVIVLGYSALSARWLAFFEWSIDEGMYLMRARMMAQGFKLYDEIWFNHPPLLVQALYAAFNQFGQSVEIARLVALAFACTGMIGVVLIARELEDWTAGLAAGVLLTATPLFFSLSRSVMSTLPALSLATLSIGLVMASKRQRDRRRTGLIVLSGLAFGTGAAVKLIVAPLGLPILLALAGLRASHQAKAECGTETRAEFGSDTRTVPAAVLRPLALWAVAAMIPIVAALAPYGQAILFEQTIGSVVGARSAYTLDVVRNLQNVLDWLSEGHLGFAALGAYGIARGLARHSEWRVVGLWLAAALVSIMLQTPLWSHHLVLLVLPLAVGAGAGIVWAIEDLFRAWRSWKVPVENSAGGWPAFGAVMLSVFLLALPVAFKRNGESTRSDSEDPWRALEALVDVTEPNQYIVTDSPMLAFRAGLFVPPNLCDPGGKRFASGSLSLADVADDIVHYQPTAIVTWNERFAREGNQALPRWLADVGWRQLVEIDSGRARRIYVPPETAFAIPDSHIEVEWKGGFVLQGVDFDTSASAPGGTLRLVLHWRASGPTEGPLTVFAHLVDDDGERVAQQDNPPGRGVRPTDHWLPGESIRDVYDIDIPPETMVRNYRLRIGLYDPESGEGWPFVGATLTSAASAESGEKFSAGVDGDAIIIEPVRVRPIGGG